MLMSSKSEKARIMARKLGLSDEEIRRRKAYLNLSSGDEAALRTLIPFFAERIPEFVERLHDRINDFPETREILERTQSQVWLKVRHGEYFVELVSGPYDMDFVLNRLTVGIVHQTIGLEFQWVQASFALFLEWALSALRSDSASLLHSNPSLGDILTKVTLFDSGLVLDSYFRAEREKVELLSRVFESNAEVVWILDDRWILRQANRTSLKIIGWNPEEIAGQGLDRFLANGGNDPHPETGVFEEIARRDGFWEGELILRHREGFPFPVWATLNIFGPSRSDPSGGFILEFRDRTSEKKTEMELRQKTEDLQRSNRDLEQFAYVASHDLQEPLRMVTSYTQLLARRYKGQLSGEADEFIRFAVDGAVRMQALINALLSYSRVETHGKPFVPCDTGKALGAALDNLRVAVVESQATIESGPLPPVLGDPIQLMQLFQNLLGNAIKFRRPDRPPEICISVGEEGGSWRFSIADNGIGIEPRFFERIFSIFQRLHSKEEYPGTGIGLAMCKRIVERHGGRIGVESCPGEGSVFFFTLGKVAMDNGNSPGSQQPEHS